MLRETSEDRATLKQYGFERPGFRATPRVRDLAFSAGGVLSLVLVLALTVVVYSWYGLDGGLSRDGAVYLYSGQRMAEGIPPYVSVFDHKGPVAPMFAGMAVIISNLIGLDDVDTVRIVFFLAGCLAVACAYVLGGSLFRSRRAGLFTALVFVGFFCFARYAVSEPEAKTPMVLFQVLALLFLSRKRWFWGCLFGSLAALVWQPMAVFPLVGVALAFVSPGGSRSRATLLALSGAGLPVAAVAAYFLAKGAFLDLVGGSILFNVRYLEREQLFAFSRFVEPMDAVFAGYETVLIPVVVSAMVAAVVVGLGTLVLLYLPQRSGVLKAVDRTPFAPILFSLPFPVAWSLMDFQGYPDFYVFIPYVAVGFGGFLYFVARRIEHARSPVLPRISFTALSCVALVAVAVVSSQVTVDLKSGESTISDTGDRLCDIECQERAAERLGERFGQNARIASVGAPEPLVLLDKENPNRYPFIIRGIDLEISARNPDGFDGYLRDLRAYDPDVISFGETTGRHEPQLTRWLNANYERETFGPWTLYVSEDAPRKDALAAAN